MCASSSTDRHLLLGAPAMIKGISSRETENSKSQIHAWLGGKADSKPRVFATIYVESGRDIRYSEAGSWGSAHIFHFPLLALLGARAKSMVLAGRLADREVGSSGALSETGCLEIA